MNYVSVFDILKVGVGPSSSHTLGPWRASRYFVRHLRNRNLLNLTTRVQVKLYGSLALTGKGHGTDIAVILGLHESDPETVEMEFLRNYPASVQETNILQVAGEHSISFIPTEDILFLKDDQLPYHPNGMECIAYQNEEILYEETWYSVGGGFVIREQQYTEKTDLGTEEEVPNAIINAADISRFCASKQCKIADLARENEHVIHREEYTNARLDQIAQEMIACIYRGCHTDGILPGGLSVKRRAKDLYETLSNHRHKISDPQEWLADLSSEKPDFQTMLKWISCFALAVNEENANFGRVVTAPTNGAAGVIPAVLAYFIAFSGSEPSNHQIQDFLLTSGVVGGLYKNGATISAAMGGCQAEIGVSSSMAAVALTEALGGSFQQALQAGEIAMEHHLGLTCDPINGLVQIPCIERNTMGAIKAITATHLALSSNPSDAKVSLDQVIKTMWETAQDMNHKYKETSLGGLATNISVIVPEC